MAVVNFTEVLVLSVIQRMAPVTIATVELVLVQRLGLDVGNRAINLYFQRFETAGWIVRITGAEKEKICTSARVFKMTSVGEEKHASNQAMVINMLTDPLQDHFELNFERAAS